MQKAVRHFRNTEVRSENSKSIDLTMTEDHAAVRALSSESMSDSGDRGTVANQASNSLDVDQEPDSSLLDSRRVYLTCASWMIYSFLSPFG